MTEIEVLLNNPHDAQQHIIDTQKRFNVVCCGRRWGKSKLAINILSECVLDGLPAGYFTPTYKLLENTYKETLAALDKVVIRKHDNQFIELMTGGVIDFWSLDNPLAGRSRKYKVAIIDEAAYAKELWQSWTQSIRPSLTDLKGDAWFMSTPKGKNDFYKLYAKGKGGEKDWMSWQMSTYTNPFIDSDEIDAAKNDLPQLAFNQEYLAEFSENISNPFGVEFIKRQIKAQSNLQPVVFGIDLAKSFDWTVVIGLDKNGSVCVFERWQSDWNQTKERIKRIVKQTPANIDSTGVGDSIVEDLQRELKKVEGYKFTSTSKQQLMESLSAGIQQSKVSFPEGIISDELLSFEFEYTKTGVKYSAPSGLHDDSVCALALAYIKSINKSNIWVI